MQRPGRTSERLRVLVFTTVFPNPAQPTHGVFTPARLGPLREACDLRVVAPIAWFRRRGKVPARGTWSGLPVEYPSFFYLPGILRGLNGVFLFASSVGRVAALRRERDFDLIDAHFTYPDGFAAVLLGAWLDRPVVVTEHGTLMTLASLPSRRPALSWALRRAARVIGVSQELARKAVALGAAEDRVEVIENGVDTRRFTPRDRREARRALGLPEEGPLLVSVGHLSRRKGHHRVIEVLPDLIRQVPGLRFAIVGGASPEGDTGPALRDQARRLGVDRHVIWAGVLPPDEVAVWLGAADVYVLSSDFEGCPCSVYEAMAAGLPVVATRVGEVERMVPEGMGILVDRPDDREGLRDALVHALGRSWDRGAIRAYAETRSWEGGAKRILAQWLAAVGRSE
jgi:teichuronic acid biosynthesis glycosyltransferase TuaC